MALGALMGILLVPVTLQIASRYMDFVPRYIWTEELARFCFIWIILIGATVAVREGTHFSADFLPHPKSRRLEAVIRIVSDLAILLVAVIFVWWGWPLVQFGLLQESEMAELPMVFIYVAWPFAGVSWMLFLGERFVDHWRLYRGEAA